MKLIARGAEAELYISEMFGKEVVVKRRIAKGYRIKELDEEIRHSRTRREARILKNAKEKGVLCPVVYYVGSDTLIMSFIKGGTIYENRDAKLLRKSGRQLARLHSADIVHGDFTPANLIVKGGEVWVIDFGLGDYSKDIEEKAIDVLLMKRSLNNQEYEEFLRGYMDYVDSKIVLKRLQQIEKRGRYVEGR